MDSQRIRSTLACRHCRHEMRMTLREWGVIFATWFAIGLVITAIYLMVVRDGGYVWVQYAAPIVLWSNVAVIAPSSRYEHQGEWACKACGDTTVTPLESSEVRHRCPARDNKWRLMHPVTP